MSILYLVNTSQADHLLRCLQRMADDDALLLIENAVIVLNRGHTAESMLVNHSADKNIYALQADLEARGIILSTQLESIQTIDYNGFVNLAVQHNLSCYCK